MTERSLDALLQLVADRRRRQVLHHLRQEPDGKTTIDDIVDGLHNGDTITDDQTTDREQLAALLYHIYLPQLADHGVVEFDPENRGVRYQPDEQIKTILDSLSDEMSIARP